MIISFEHGIFDKYWLFHLTEDGFDDIILNK